MSRTLVALWLVVAAAGCSKSDERAQSKAPARAPQVGSRPMPPAVPSPPTGAFAAQALAAVDPVPRGPISSLKVRIVTSGEQGAGTFDDVYFDIGPLGWKLVFWSGNLWGWRSDFPAGSDRTVDLPIPSGLTLGSHDILWLRLQKKGIGGWQGAPDSASGRWKPHWIGLYVNGMFPTDQTSAFIDQWIDHDHWFWKKEVTNFIPDSPVERFVRSLRVTPNAQLTQAAETLAVLITPFKYAGISGWLGQPLPTTCATGTVYRPPGISTDGLATIDLRLEKLEFSDLVSRLSQPQQLRSDGPRLGMQEFPKREMQEFILDGQHEIEHTRYLRVEYNCGLQTSVGGSKVISIRCGNPIPQNGQRARICGEVMWDTDFEGWWEIHPRGPSDVTILRVSGSPQPVQPKLPQHVEPRPKVPTR